MSPRERQPAIVGHRRRLGGVLEVLEVGSAFEEKLAGLPGGKLVAVVSDDVHRCHRYAHRTGMGEPFLGADRGARESLGATVIFVNDRPEPLHHPVLDIDRARGGRMDHAAQAGDVILFPNRLGQLEHPHEHRRHELGVGDAVGLDQPQHGLGVELSHEDRRGTDAVDRHGVVHSGGVIQRCGGEVHAGPAHPVAVGQRHLQHRLRPGAVAVGRQRPADGLGPPRGARRIEHLRPVRHRRRVARRRQRVLVGRASRAGCPRPRGGR